MFVLGKLFQPNLVFVGKLPTRVVDLDRFLNKMRVDKLM
jgi:hypothetical protein